MEENRVNLTLTREQAYALMGAANYMAKKRRKDAKKKPFIPQPGHLNLNERKAELLTGAIREIRKKLDLDKY